MNPGEQNATATPLATAGKPQNGAPKRHDGTLRKEKSARLSSQSKAHRIPIECKRDTCARTFLPKRLNQEYCTERCRKQAYVERNEAGIRLDEAQRFVKLWDEGKGEEAEARIAELAKLAGAR